MGEPRSTASASGPTSDGDPAVACGRRDLLRAGAGGTVVAGGVAAGAGSAAAQAYDGWFDGVDNYEGTVDYRGREEVRVAVGTGDDGLLFDPPAILVDQGATVVWEWTGEGGSHNVVHEPGDDGEPAFATDLAGEEGFTFSQTFDAEEGTIFRYYCEPHRPAGMRGAVAVGEVDDELVEPGGAGGSGGPLDTTDLLVVALGLGMVGFLLLILIVPAYRREESPRQVRGR